MKNIGKLLIPILLMGALITGASDQLHASYGISPLISTISMVMLCLFALAMPGRAEAGLHTAGIQKEIWSKYIMAAIFKYNAWLQFAFSADDFVMQGKVVHIPQAGTAAAVVKNRSSLPATVTKRTDTDVTYPLDEFTTDPRLIPNADTVELSYDKMDSVMTDDMQALRQTFAENMLIAWAPAANFVRTTGADIAAHLPSATGNRKKFLSADLQKAMTFMNKQDVPTEERFAMMSSEMYDQLVSQFTESQYRDFSRAYDEKTGVLGMLHGFKILQRSTCLVYNNASTPVVKAYGAAGATSDNDAVLCWQKNAVERAMGEVKVFNKDNDPQYYGDLFSFLMRGGGRIRRSDEIGVVAIVQAAGS